MISSPEHVQHSASPKRELCYASDEILKTVARGRNLLFYIFWKILSFYSYDGAVFRSHPNSKSAHHETTLAISDGIPLAVGGFTGSYFISKAEIFNIATNTWEEVADYPYHEE